MADLTAMDYDTQALRAAAKKIRSCARSVDGGTRPGIRRIQGELHENLEGSAAVQLDARLQEMAMDANALVGTLNGIANALMKYAADLDRMAQQLRAKMES